MAFIHRQLSVTYSNVDVRWNISPILEGDMNQLPPVSSHTIRVFLSSTFSDMISERNALMEYAYPALKDFCRQYRLEFQAMDLRWGIREQSHDDHTIIDFCLREIENCKKTSLGPNFVILLGQKYGYRPFPPQIGCNEFEMIYNELRSNRISTKLLSVWFKKNTNVVPHVYMLQPISSILLYYNDKGEGAVELHEKALKEWEDISDHLRNTLRRGVSLCYETGKISTKERDKYFTSVTEYEIEKGLLTSEKPNQETLCFFRYITNLERNVHNVVAQKFIDVLDGGQSIDRDAQDLLDILKTKKIKKVLTDERNIESFDLTWKHPKQSNPSDDAEYLHEFCNNFRDKMQWMISRAVTQTQSISCNSQIIEILQHLKMCKTLSQDFRGRELTLRKIRSYLTVPADRPLVLFGESGSGKTSVIAKVADRVKKWVSETDKKSVILLRFLGTTSHSCSIRLVLGSMCWHIANVYGKDISKIPGDYPGLITHFLEMLKSVPSNQPLIILLDGLDQLSSAHRAHSLAWLPKLLPPNVHIILSTLPDKYELLETLRMYLTSAETNFIEILPLGSQLSINLLKEWLNRSDRNLTAVQFKIVEEALHQCTLALYTSLIFEEVCRWCSYFSDEQSLLEPTVHGIINKLFDRLEKYHGYIFVSHSLAYLTASKNGLSDTEIEDILSLDDEVLNDVFQHWLPPVRRIPPLLIPRLQDELSRYILQREANGTIVFYWYHRQFIDVAQERYLSDEMQKSYVHMSLAHYFLGTWGDGRKKAFKYSQRLIENGFVKEREATADRMVPKQPLHFGLDPNHPGRLNYNLRKLSELPYHLLASRLFGDLKSQILFNYEWLHAKLSAMSLHEVLSDFQQTLEWIQNMRESGTRQQTKESDIMDSDIQLLASALRLGGTHLNQNPDMLAFDLLGRLLCYYDQKLQSVSPNPSKNKSDVIQKSPSDHTLNRIRRFRLNNIQSLLQQCDIRSSKHSALLPVLQCFDSPTTMSVYILEGHSSVVTDLIFSSNTRELISVSKERIAFWDLDSGELSRSIDDVGDDYPGRKKIFLSDDERYLIVDCDIHDTPVNIYDMKTLQLLHSSGSRLPTQKRVFLSGTILCRQKSFIDIRTGMLLKTLDDFISSKTYVTCAVSPDGNLVLIGDETETKLIEFNTSKQLATFKGSTLSVAMVITNDSKRAYVGYAETCLFCVLNINREEETFGKILMTFDKHLEFMRQVENNERELKGDEVSEISISPVDDSVVLLNINHSHLIFLNVETTSWVVMNTSSLLCEGEMPVWRQTGPGIYIFRSLFSGNGLFVLGCIENFLHIWIPEDGSLLHTITLHTTQLYTIAVHKNLVATGSTVNTAIRVWDLENIQESKMPTIKVYEGPLDCVACADQSRLVFIKSQLALSNHKGFKYLDFFGIDVWNIATGSCSAFLPFDRYGRLLQMSVSRDGEEMALLLNAVDDWYIVVFNTMTSEIIHVFLHKKCMSFRTSISWDFFVSCVSNELTNEIKLWDVNKDKEIICIDNAKCPVFTLDGFHMLYIDVGQLMNNAASGIITYSLTSFGPICRIECVVDSIRPFPVHHHLVLATKFKDLKQESNVDVLTILKDKPKLEIKLKNVGSRGIVDISKDGNLGVDARLQIFNLLSGELKMRFSLIDVPVNKEFNNVRITYDGLYVIWTFDDMSVKVGQIASGNIIAHTSIHERLVNLEIMDYGYIVIAGGADGHLVVMKLSVDDDDEVHGGKVTYRAQSTEDRRNFLLDTLPCNESFIQKMDSNYHINLKLFSDDSLPTTSLPFRKSLLMRANVPLTIISTNKQEIATDEYDGLHKRRLSTPVNLQHIANLMQNANSSTTFLSVPSESKPRMFSASSVVNLSQIHFCSKHKPLKKRCSSVQDLNKTTRNAASATTASPGRLLKMPGFLSQVMKHRVSKEKNILPSDDAFRVAGAVKGIHDVLINAMKISPRTSKNSDGINVDSDEQSVL